MTKPKTRGEHCPQAKLLAGTWHCPCHGMEKGAGRPPKKDDSFALLPRPYRERVAERKGKA
jgi:hypothetical protein